MNNLFKKTIAAFIAFIITFNLILFNYQRPRETHAYAVAGSVAFDFAQAFFQTFFFNQSSGTSSSDHESAEALIAEEFIEDLQQNHPTVYNGLNMALSSLTFGDYGSSGYKIGSCNVPQWVISGLFNAASSFLSAKGNYNSETGTYNYELPSSSSSGSLPYTVVNSVAEYKAAYLSYFNEICGHNVTSNGVNFLPDSDSVSVVTLCPHPDSIGNTDGMFVVHGDYPDCVTGTFSNSYGTHHTCNAYVFFDTDHNVTYDWHDVTEPYSAYAKIYLNYGAQHAPSDLTEGDSPVYGPTLESRFNFLDDAAVSDAISDFSDTRSDDVVTHAPDGTISTSRETTFQAVFQETTNETTGETEFVAVSPSVASQLGLSVDDVFSKPAETVITQPLVDTQTGEDVKVGAVTGAVSITNTQAIADAIAGDFVTGREGFDDFEIQRDLTTVFPFCLPFDIMRILDTFRADPVCPVIRFDFTQVYPFSLCPASYHDNLQFVLDFADYDVFIRIEKFAVIISYVLFLITKTRSALIRG